ncbi:MAG: hypothetical protein ABI200_04825 [Gaiellales bacterium]
MSVDQLLDEARALPVAVIAVLGALATLLVVFAVTVQRSAWRLRTELQDAEQELVDRRTGLLPQSALRIRLGAELAWASASRTPLAVLVLHIKGSRFRHATRTLRAAMREEESAFVLGEQHVAVELWDADPEEALVATQRLGETLAAAGHPVIDAGIACAPRDGSDVETLVDTARRDLRPINDPIAPGRDVGSDGRARGRGLHAGAYALQVLTWLGASALLLLVCWRLVPAAIEPLLDGGQGRTGRELAIMLATLLGLPIGAALVQASAWNQRRGSVPRSRPLHAAGVRTMLTILLIVAAPLTWGIWAPESPATLPAGFGATLAVLALLVLALLHARQLVHLPLLLLVLLAGLGGVTAWAGVKIVAMPLVSITGQLLLVASIGAIVARHVQRASWILVIAAVSAVISATADVTGTTAGEWLLGNRIVDTLTVPGLASLSGPVVAGAPLFSVTTTALALLALYLSWCHEWRLDLRYAGGAMLLATWAWALTDALMDTRLTLTPWLGAAAGVLVLARSLLLRGRVSAATSTFLAD